MRKSKKFIGMPVISLAEGQQIGIVKGLVVDPVQQKVAALIIEQKGWFKEQKFAPYGKVRSIGNDAITLDESTVVEKGASLPEILKLFKEKITLIGCKAMMENGSQLGVVEEYFVEEESGNIVGLELSGNLLNSLLKGSTFLDINFVNIISTELVVTSTEAIDNTIKIDGGLQETVKQIRESTGQIWENTLQKTKELGSKTKELSSKTKEDLESKTKDLGSLTKDLGESLKEQFDKVRGKDKADTESEDKVEEISPTPNNEDSLNRSVQPIEDAVEVVDLPPEALNREEKPEPAPQEVVEVVEAVNEPEEFAVVEESKEENKESAVTEEDKDKNKEQ